MMLRLVFLSLIALLACGGSPRGEGTALNELITAIDAEMILGGSAQLTDSSTRHDNGVRTYHCTYEANEVEAGTGRRGAIYYVIEEYSQLKAAQAKYTSIKAANARHEGITVLDDLGDEAYFHSDGTNFLFIMARKGARVLIMKVNKITTTTSREAFDATAKKITSGL